MIVFASAIGQHDNVGDTVLRRAYLNALRNAGDLHVYVGSQTDNQIGALGMQAGDVLVRSSEAWRRGLTARVGREPFVYGFDTGETELQRRFAARYARLAPILVANRARGGRSVHVGVGVRRSTKWRVPIRAALRLPDIVTWRDTMSRRVVGVGGVSPDWAFATGGGDDEPGERPVLAIAVRASLSHSPRTEPDDAWADRAGALAADHGLRPVFVAQIGRDGPLAERLAHRIGAETLVWESPDHSAFEARLRAMYRISAGVLSDRLHGLVIGATEGAVPLALASDPHDKTVRTLDAVGIRDVTVPPDLSDVEGVGAMLARRQGVVSAVRRARTHLEDLTARIGGLGI